MSLGIIEPDVSSPGGAEVLQTQEISEGATMSSYLTRVAILVGLGTVVAGAIAFAQDRQASTPTAVRGTDVFNSIEGRLLVTKSRSEGARVEAGEVVCELDATELEERLASQETAVRAVEAELLAAGLAREVAVLAFAEYAQAGYIAELAETEGAIKLAEAKLSRAEAQLDWSRRMYEKGYRTLAEKITDELALKEARFGLELAQAKKKLLVDHTRKKATKALQGELEAARARELIKHVALERERSAQKALSSQIRRCKVTAPNGGRVHYAAPIGAGAVVRDGQLLFTIVADGNAGAVK
jgi:multidrug resistance efflux pump